MTTRWTARRIARSLAIFLVLLAVGAWPWDRVTRGFSALYCPIANLVIGHQTFGKGGQARLVPLGQVARRDGDNVTADTALALGVAGFTGDVRLGVSLRRDAYLPLWILVALIAASPLPTVRRLKALSVAIPILTALNLAALEVLVVWTFAFQLRSVYDAGALLPRVIDLAYGALLTPPGNRFIVPLGIGIALIMWLRDVDVGTGPDLTSR